MDKGLDQSFYPEPLISEEKETCRGRVGHHRLGNRWSQELSPEPDEERQSMQERRMETPIPDPGFLHV